MARFKYLGEPPRPELVVSYGPCEAIRTHLKNGSMQLLEPVPPATSFPIGDDIGHEITDERSLRFFRNDPRFEELV